MSAGFYLCTASYSSPSSESPQREAPLIAPHSLAAKVDIFTSAPSTATPSIVANIPSAFHPALSPRRLLFRCTILFKKQRSYSYHQTKNQQARHTSKPSPSCHRIHTKLFARRKFGSPSTRRQSRDRTYYFNRVHWHAYMASPLANLAPIS